MAHFVYENNGQKVASGLRQFWIDPTTGETLVMTSSVRTGDTLTSTLRAVRYVPDQPIDLGSPPAGGTITLNYEVPA